MNFDNQLRMFLSQLIILLNCQYHDFCPLRDPITYNWHPPLWIFHNSRAILAATRENAVFLILIVHKVNMSRHESLKL